MHASPRKAVARTRLRAAHFDVGVNGLPSRHGRGCQDRVQWRRVGGWTAPDLYTDDVVAGVKPGHVKLRTARVLVVVVIVDDLREL
jgi:hypothetical protein